MQQMSFKVPVTFQTIQTNCFDITSQRWPEKTLDGRIGIQSKIEDCMIRS